MAPLTPKRQDHVVGLAAGALLCSLLTQRLLTRQTELLSEALAWLALPFLVAPTRQREGEIAAPLAASKSSGKRGGYVVFSVGIAVASFCRAENGTSRFYPALVPLLLAVQKFMQLDLGETTRGSRGTLAPLFTSLAATSITAAIAVVDLSIWDLEKLIYAAVALVAVLFAYMTLLPQRRRRSGSFPSVRMDEDIDQISKCVVLAIGAVFILQTVVFGLTMGPVLPTVAAAVFKCLSWFFAIQLSREAPWSFLPSMGVFTLMAGQSPYFQSSAFRPLLHVALSAVSLGQVITVIPSRAKSKTGLWLFMLATVLPFGANWFAIRHAQHAITHTFGGMREHPVDILMRGARAQFDGIVHRQSRSLKQAQGEYRHRYNMDPPPGFEAWYKFAVDNQSPIIDEFDTVHKKIAPFLQLSGAQVKKAMDTAYQAGESELWSCRYVQKEAKARCVHPRRSYDRHISHMFETIGKHSGIAIPDVEFLVNHLDEPTVLLPDEETTDIVVTNIGGQPTWGNITRGCAAHHAEHAHMKDERESYALPFIKDSNSAMDLCRHPEYENMHGLFLSPTSMKLVDGMVPILSTGAPSTMGDILIPSPAYMEAEFIYDSDSEPSFYEKKNNVYWAGSTSGARATDDKWHNFHRQRFVQFAQNLGREQYYYLEQKRDTVERVPSSFLNGRLFDVAFTRVFQCLSRQCREQRAFFPPGAWADKDAALKSRLVFDLDGNGISGRWYKLLASKSLPLKQTLLHEWHDERLIPWVHYVPISQSLEELPELVMYLTSTEEGQARAKLMADQGRQWYGKAMREVDMAIYVYRLMLELARLQDPARPALK